MKIGKVDYKKMALSSLEECWISEQLETATIKINEAIQNIENHAKNVESEYENAKKSVAHLEAKSSLTEDEYFELEGTLGWMENYFEDSQLQITSLSQGLIIVVSNFTKQVIKNAKGCYWYGKIEPDSCQTLMKLGPKINSIFWAEALNAASNYVRHSDEWSVNQHKKIILDNGDIVFEEIKDPVSMLQRLDSKKNATIIEGLGIPSKNFLVNKHDISRNLCNLLSLDDSSTLKSNFSEWQLAVASFIKEKIK